MRPTYLAAIILTIFSPIAMADVIPPDVSNCEDKNAGDSCQTEKGASGSCVLVKNGRCRFHPDSGTTCTDALTCISQAAATGAHSSNAAMDQNTAPTEGCSFVGTTRNTLSFASFGLGMMILLAIRSMRRKRT